MILYVIVFLLGAMGIPSGSIAAESGQPSDATTIQGTVVDSVSGAPIHVASVTLEYAGRAALTDPEGRFRISQVVPGVHQLAVRHVAYDQRTVTIAVDADVDTVLIEISLIARAHRLQEITVGASRAMQLTSGMEAHYTLPRAVITELPIDNMTEIVKLLPGVVVSGDRPFFRGIGFEHIVPLIDGVQSREPLRGEWITPPPDAIQTADLVSSAFDAEHGQALGGVMAISLPDGGPTHHARLSYSGDRLSLASTADTRTDHMEVSAGGPLAGSSSFYSVAWQGRLSDTYLSYGHAAPEQTFFDIFSLGDRERGEQTGSVRLILSPEEGSWKAAATMLHVDQRRKHYHDHYSRSGWVGYEADYDRYTIYLDDPAEADSVVFNDSAPNVPTRRRRSTLAIGTFTKRFGARASARLHVRHSNHSYEAGIEGRDFKTNDDVLEWLHHETTRLNHQEDWFYATHGEYPEFEDGSSSELSAGGSFRLRSSGGHDLQIGAGGTVGRHQLLHVLAGSKILAGSLDESMKSLDGYAYIQDTWWSDRLSSMKVGLRWDGQRISGYPGTAYGSTVSPRIGFHQPMSEVDAFHAQVGVLYQFPSLIGHFPQRRVFAGEGVTLTAQRTRAYEIGVQHHFSDKMIAYVGSYSREYSDVIFSERQPSEYDVLFTRGVSEEPQQTIEGYGVEIVIDHRFHPAIHGQLSMETGKMTRDGKEVPWSRKYFMGGWLLARPRTDLHLAMSWIWSAGRPYSICLKPKGCPDDRLYEGRLPDLFEVDLEAQWHLSGRFSRVRLKAEVRNALGRRTPSHDFGIYSSRVGVGNFLAYYDETGRAGGYLVDLGTAVRLVDISNPQTRRPGRNVRLGIEVRF